MSSAILVATISEPLPDGRLSDVPSGVGALELRADLVGEVDPSRLREGFSGRLIYTSRTTAEGGRDDGDALDRHERLRAAAAGFDLVDLEADRDLVPEVLDGISPDRRLVSWHGTAPDREALLERLERMTATPAALYKVVPTPRQIGDELWPLHLLRQSARRDVVAFAGGTSGVWTRLVAPLLGAPWIYGSLSETPAAPGQPSVRRLLADYPLPGLPAVEALFGVVGFPVLHSLSPRLHNRLYREAGLPYLYLPFETESFGDFWLEVVEEGTLDELGLPIRGLSVTAPYKGAALAVAGAVSPLAERIGAVNTLVYRGGVWEGENTDCEGVMLSLRRHGREVAGRPAVVVGGGRAGRAAAFALKLEGAEVVLVNRSEERGRIVAEELGVPFLPLERFDPHEFRIVVHATSLGREPGDPLPFDVGRLPGGSVLVDLVYGEGPTPLVQEARAHGVETVSGREVLLHQALGQFRLMTGREMPLASGLEALGLEP